jgi:hypothetical protein
VDDKPQIIQIVDAAQKLNDDELRQVLEILSDELKHRYRRADQIAAAALRVGDWVEMTKGAKKLPAGAKGHIVEIRREQVDIHFPEHGMFGVSAAALRKIEKPPAGCPKPEPGV